MFKTLITVLLIILPISGHAAPSTIGYMGDAENFSTENLKSNASLGYIGMSLHQSTVALDQSVVLMALAMENGALMLMQLDRMNPDHLIDDNVIVRLDEMATKIQILLGSAKDELQSVEGVPREMREASGFRSSVLYVDMRAIGRAAMAAESNIDRALQSSGTVKSAIQLLSTRSAGTAIRKVRRNLKTTLHQTQATLEDVKSLEGSLGVWVDTIQPLEGFLWTLLNNYFCGGQFVTILGTNNSEVIEGTIEADVINGRGGDDEIYGEPIGMIPGKGGADIICGGDGNDSIYGNFGDDEMYGGIGDDFIKGSMGIHRIWGGPGNDYIAGGSGGDIIFGNRGNDTIFAYNGDDVVYGGYGDDSIRGGEGDDWIYGNHGSDFLYGQDGNDHLYGGPSNGNLEASDNPYPEYLVCGGPYWDYIWGGSGNDIMLGEGGKDYMKGDNGNDTIVGGYCLFGDNCIPTEEQINFPDDRDCIYAGEGDDLVYGRDGNDYINGDFGKDTLIGGKGNDLIYGSMHDDVLEGNEGNDWLVGDLGSCFTVNASGNDSLYGGIGDDYLNGGPLNDYCDGDGGSDTHEGGCETIVDIP